MITVWAEKEMRNLSRMHSAGLPVPKPVIVKQNVLVMDFIGTDGWPALLLRVINFFIISRFINFFIVSIGRSELFLAWKTPFFLTCLNFQTFLLITVLYLFRMLNCHLSLLIRFI